MLLDIQSGGKLIAEGAYGCVFDRPLKCSRQGQRQGQGMIGKVTLQPQAEIEIKQSDFLEKNPYAKNYFTLISNTCKLSPRKTQIDADISKCDVIAEHPYKNLLQITMPYSGRSLASFKKAIDTKNIHFYEFGRHLLEAGSILLSNNIIHHDLHTGNILVKNPKTPIIIDFGLSWKAEILTEKIAEKFADSGYSPEYSHYAPELSLPEASMEGLKLNDKVFVDILEKNGTSRILERVFGIPFKKTVDGLREFTEDSTSIEKRDWLLFYKTYWPKFDAWAIGRILLRIYALLVFDPKFKDDTHQYIYRNVLVRLLQTNPRRRINVVQALALWDPSSPILKLDGVVRWSS